MTRVVEFEAETRRVHEYTGTWTEYAAARERARAQHETAYSDYVDERERYATLLATRRNEAHGLGTQGFVAEQLPPLVTGVGTEHDTCGCRVT